MDGELGAGDGVGTPASQVPVDPRDTTTERERLREGAERARGAATVAAEAGD